ncbi:MAG: hypothetical protein ABIK08_03030 [Pseudomonadota bacterium]
MAVKPATDVGLRLYTETGRGIVGFGVKRGVVQPDILALDADVSDIESSGWIDPGQERLDLDVVPTSKASRVALRSQSTCKAASPINIKAI